MQKLNAFRTVVGRLPVIAGSLLMVTAIAHATVTSVAAPEVGSAAPWSMVREMLPIPGGVNATPEIDLDSVGNGIALLCGGVLLLVGLRRKPRAAQQ